MQRYILLALIVLCCTGVSFGQSAIPPLDTGRVYQSGIAGDHQALQSFIFEYERQSRTTAHFYVVFVSSAGTNPSAYLNRLIKTWHKDRRFDWDHHIVILHDRASGRYFYHFGDTWAGCYDLTNSLATQQIMSDLPANTGISERIRRLDGWIQNQQKELRTLIATTQAQIDETRDDIRFLRKNGVHVAVPSEYDRLVARFQQTIKQTCDLKRIRALVVELSIARGALQEALDQAEAQQKQARLALQQARNAYERVRTQFRGPALILEWQSQLQPVRAEIDSLLKMAGATIETDYEQSLESSASALNLIHVLETMYLEHQQVQQKAFTVTVKIEDRLDNLAKMNASKLSNIPISQDSLNALNQSFAAIQSLRERNPELYLAEAEPILAQLDSIKVQGLTDRTVSTVRKYGDIIITGLLIVLVVLFGLYVIYHRYVRMHNISVIMEALEVAWGVHREHSESLLTLLMEDFPTLIFKESNRKATAFTGATREIYQEALQHVSLIRSQQRLADLHQDKIRFMLQKLSYWHEVSFKDAISYLINERVIEDETKLGERVKLLRESQIETFHGEINKLVSNLDQYYELATSQLQGIQEARTYIESAASNCQLFFNQIEHALSSVTAPNISTAFYETRSKESESRILNAESIRESDPLSAQKEYELAEVVLRSLLENLSQLPEYLQEIQSLTLWIEDFNRTVKQLRDSGMKLREEGGPEPLIESAKAALYEGECHLSQGRIFGAKNEFQNARNLLEEANATILQTIDIRDHIGQRIEILQAENEALYEQVAEAMVPLSDMRKNFQQNAFLLENDNVDESVVILDKCRSLLTEAETYIQPFMQKFQAAWKIIREVEQMHHGVQALIDDVKNRRTTLYQLKRETRHRFKELLDFYGRVHAFLQKHKDKISEEVLHFMTQIGLETVKLQRYLESDSVKWEELKVHLVELEKAVAHTMTVAEQSVEAHKSFQMQLLTTAMKQDSVEEFLDLHRDSTYLAREIFKAAKRLIREIQGLAQHEAPEWTELIRLLSVAESWLDEAKSYVNSESERERQARKVMQFLYEPEQQTLINRIKRDKTTQAIIREVNQAFKNGRYEDAIHFAFKVMTLAHRENTRLRIEYKSARRREKFWELESRRRTAVAKTLSEHAANTIKQARERSWYLTPPTFLTTETVVPSVMEEEDDFFEMTGTHDLTNE